MSKVTGETGIRFPGRTVFFLFSLSVLCSLFLGEVGSHGKGGREPTVSV